MLRVDKFRYIGFNKEKRLYMFKSHKDKLYYARREHIPNDIKLIKNFEYIGLVINNKPNIGYIMLGFNNKSLCRYAREVIKYKKHSSIEMLENYRKVFLEDKKLAKYVYRQSGISNKLLITDETLANYVSKYIIELCMSTTLV